MIFQKELILIRQVHQKNVCVVIIGVSIYIGYKFEPNICNKCHDVLITAYKLQLKNIAIPNVNGVDYRCILWGISRNGTANVINNSVLEDQGVL